MSDSVAAAAHTARPFDFEPVGLPGSGRSFLVFSTTGYARALYNYLQLNAFWRPNRCMDRFAKFTMLLLEIKQG